MQLLTTLNQVTSEPPAITGLQRATPAVLSEFRKLKSEENAPWGVVFDFHVCLRHDKF
jgi:hypothetical protein